MDWVHGLGATPYPVSQQQGCSPLYANGHSHLPLSLLQLPCNLQPSAQGLPPSTNLLLCDKGDPECSSEASNESAAENAPGSIKSRSRASKEASEETPI